MAHRSPRESELLPLLEENQRKLYEHEQLDYRRVFDIDAQRTDITTTWGVCLVRDTTNSKIIVEFYSFYGDGNKCNFASDYYLQTFLEGYNYRKKKGGGSLSLWHDPHWVLEWNDYRDIAEDIKNYLKY